MSADNTSSEQLYVKLGNPKKVAEKSILLALTIADDLQPVIVSGVAISWTKPAILVLSDLQKAAAETQIKNLPYASLRGLLQVGLTNLARLHTDIGLNFKYLNSPKDPEPFGYVVDTDERTIQKTLRPLLNDWITNYLKPFADRGDVPSLLLDRLEDLREQNELVKLSNIQSQVLPWPWNEDTGTTQAKDTHAYPLLVDYAARSIAGHEIFAGLGAIKRVISSSGRFTSGIAELITQPIELEEGIFSLVVTLEVVTFPSINQPVLRIDVSKRRWLSDLEAPKFDRQNINGVCFTNTCEDRVFSFRVSAKKDETDTLGWQTNNDFEALRRQLRLPMQSFDGQGIATRQADTQSCRFFLTYRNGLGDSGINVGVPEIDKLEAFEAIENILQPLGFIRFDNFSVVKANVSHKIDREAARTINTPTLLRALLQQSVTNSSDLTSNYLAEIGEDRFKALFEQHLGISIEKTSPGKVLEFNRNQKEQISELTALIQSNQAAIHRLYPNERVRLIIFYESELHQQVKLLQALVRLLWGDTIDLLLNQLPDNVHGVKATLPGSNLNAKDRSELRQQAWQSMAQQIEDRKQQTFCLVVARKFYPNPTKPDRVSPDDRINKPSTRQALAMASSCVQFLLPLGKTKKDGSLKLEDFFHRAQSALKDLLFAHSGCVDGIQEKVDKYLDNIPAKDRPKEIIGITIVRKQKGRVRGIIENTFLPIAIRINVETGKCQMCCAYEKGNSLAISPYSDFADALAFVSQVSPVKLADKQPDQKTRFMKFVKQVISESADAGAQPLVIIDSSNCVQLWGWLADIRMSADRIDLGTQSQHMQQEWEGVRIVRVRQELAPGAIEKTERHLAETTLADDRSKKDLTSDLTIPSASSSSSKLFRLNSTHNTGCVTYLSTGNKYLNANKRGQSCYRSTQQPESVKDGSTKAVLSNIAGLKIDRVVPVLPFIGQYPTPNPVEMVVTLRQEKDDPDRIATLVESLRYGLGHVSDWVALPTPLFFERVVRDYISEFSIDDDEEEDEDS
jgi:hypothetical protein